MENASKALIMAAEVLVGVLILSLMVYLFVSFGSSSAQVNEQMDEKKLAEFNSQYDKYKDKEDVTIYDIVSLANLATENNKYYGLDESTESNYYISILLDNTHLELKASQEDTQNVQKNKIIKEKIEKGENVLQTYKCNVIYSTITGRVRTVKFTK